MSPPTPAPPYMLNPPSAYVVNRKLCTIRLAKADTPAMPHTPTIQHHGVGAKLFNFNKRGWHCEQSITTPASRNMIPAARVIVALMLSSMLPIFKHFSANMAMRHAMAPRTIPTIIKARTACSKAERKDEMHINILFFD